MLYKIIFYSIKLDAYVKYHFFTGNHFKAKLKFRDLSKFHRAVNYLCLFSDTEILEHTPQQIIAADLTGDLAKHQLRQT